MNVFFSLAIITIHFLLFKREVHIFQNQYYNTYRFIKFHLINLRKSLHSFSLRDKRKSKIKPLVWTHRVKRMAAWHLLVDGVTLGLLFYYLDDQIYFGLTLLISYLFYPFLFLLIHFLSLPLEKRIQVFYLKKAKETLRQVHPIVIGITGSYGKTSTKTYLNQLINHHFVTLISPFSVNTPMGLSRVIVEQLTARTEVFIAEMGVDQKGGMRHLINLLQPTHGIITAIGPQHLATFKTMAAITKEKMSMALSIHPPGLVILNGDNSYINSYSLPSNIYKRTYGLGYNNEVSGTILEESFEGTSFVIHYQNKDYRSWTPLLGKHHILNLLGAITMALQLGISMQSIQKSLRHLSHEPHRLSRSIQGHWKVLDDSYNSNKEGFIEAVEVLSKLPAPRVLITPGVVELGKLHQEVNYELGKFASQKVDEVYLIGKENIDAMERAFLEQKDVIVYKFKMFSEAQKELIKRREETLSILIENDLPDIILE